MELINLGNAALVTTMLRSDKVLVEIGGSIRRISLDNLMAAVDEDNGELLRQVAWGVPIMDSEQSGQDWGVIGNTEMRDECNRGKGRYLLTNNGLAAKLSTTSSDVYADGTPLDESKGHIMTRRPRLYYVVKKDALTGLWYLWMSILPIGGYYIEERWDGAYMGSIVNGALVSRSGLVPSGSRTITQFWEYAQANGKDFGLSNYDFRRYRKMEELGDYGNPNIQEMVGYGVGGSTQKDIWAAAAKLTTGATKSLGDATGKIDITLVSGSVTGDNCSRVSVHGTEDDWGWFWQMTPGIYFGNSGNSGQDGTECYIYEGNRVPTSNELAAHPTGNYRQITRCTSSGYVKLMYGGDYFDVICKSIGGGTNSYWGDYYWANTTGQLLLWGGYADDGPFAGSGYGNSYLAFSYSNANFGARLAYYGTVTIVDGKDIA